MLGALYCKTHIVFLFVFLILSYPIQVVFDSLLISKVFYLWIAFISFYFVFFTFKDKINYKGFTYTFICYCLIILFGSFQEYLFNYSEIEFIRLLLLYLFPIIFFYYFIVIKRIDSMFIFKILVVICSLISLETLYEFFCYVDATFYQQMNINYVEKIIGTTPWHILPSLRDNGLMSHPHVSAIYIAFGLLLSTILYINIKKSVYLLGICITFSGLIASGTRLAIISVIIFLLFYLFKTYKANRNKWLIVILVYTLSLVSLFIFSYDYTQFWIAVYLQYLPNEVFHFIYNVPELEGSIADQIQKSIIYATKNNSVQLIQNVIPEYHFFPSIDIVKDMYLLLFGIGLGSLGEHLGIINDNIFFLQLMYQLGIVGSSILIYMFLNTYFKGIKLLNKSEYHLKVIIWVSLAFMTLVSISLLHSGVFVKKGVYAMTFFFIFLVQYLYQEFINEDTN